MNRKKKKASNDDSDNQYVQTTIFDYLIQQQSNLNNETSAINSKIESEVSINTTEIKNIREKLKNNSVHTINTPEITEGIKTDSFNEYELESFDPKTISAKPSEGICQLYIPVTYEEIVKAIGKKSAKIAELIVPVTEFEKQITQVVNDIKNSGYLLFLIWCSWCRKVNFYKFFGMANTYSNKANNIYQR